jgi:hypothetical protein
MPVIALVFLMAAGIGAGIYALVMRDLIRRGLQHRRNEQLKTQIAAGAMPVGRVPCPECAEAILPQARRCPYCRSVIAARV